MREPQSGTPSEPFGRGLILFRPGTPRRLRRGRLVFIAVYLVIGAAIVWPVYPLFAGPDPRILGLPLFFAWIVGALLAMFVSLLVLFKAESHDEET